MNCSYRLKSLYSQEEKQRNPLLGGVSGVGYSPPLFSEVFMLRTTAKTIEPIKEYYDGKRTIAQGPSRRNG